jgi:Na+-driven multidrug efflux pump
MIFMPLQGLSQGVQPIIGYNYGAKKYERVKTAFKLAVTYATIFVLAGFVLVQIFPGAFIAVFRNEQGPLMDMGIRILRISALILPVLGFQFITSTFFQAIGKPVQGTILSLSRQILFYIPLLLILPGFFGINGVFFSMPLADICSATLSIIFMYREFKLFALQARTSR